MTIPWTQEQRADVDEVLVALPPSSHRCDEAARRILPIARVLDPGAGTLRVVADPAQFPRGTWAICPKHPVGRTWYEHWTVSVVAHCVDALTRTEGCEESSYLETHWLYPDALVLERKELPGTAEPDQ